MVSLPPVVKGYLFYDGVWNDISNKMRQTESISITRGAGSEQGENSPTKADLLLDNRTGIFSPRNPSSPLFDKIGRNTPMKIELETGPPYLEIPFQSLFNDSAIVAVDQPQLDFTSDVDIRIDGASRVWHQYDAGAAILLAERWEATGNNRCWKFARHRTGALWFGWSTDGTFGTLKYELSTELVPWYSDERVAVRVTVDVNNGAGGYTVKFWYSNQMDGEWTLLGDPIVRTAGTTNVFNGAGAAPVWVGAPDDGNLPDGTGFTGMFDGKIYAYQQRNGIDGPVTVDFVAKDEAVGATSFTDATGVSWTTQEDAVFTNKHTRISGEVPSWPPGRSLAGSDKNSRIEVTGITRRLDAGTKPLESALLRYIRSLSSPPIECWPMTDGEQAERGASLVGGQPIIPSLDVGSGKPYEWASANIASWIEPVGVAPSSTNGQLNGLLPYSANAELDWSVDFFFAGIKDDTSVLHLIDVTTPTDTDGQMMFNIEFDASADRILLTRTSTTESGSSFAILANITPAGVYDGKPHHFRMNATPGGASTDWFLYIDGQFITAGTMALGSRALKQVRFNWFLNSSGGDGYPFGFITYWALNSPPVEDIYTAFIGFPGETSNERFQRLLTEQNLEIDSFGGNANGLPSELQRMGTQQLKKLMDNLQACADSDVGIFMEKREKSELILRARASLYNQAPRFTLDFSNGVVSAPFAPVDDDKLTENDVVVKRTGGSFSQRVLTTGRMSVQDYPNGVGRYDVSKERSLFEDDQTDDLAYWFLHTGTFDGLRYTRLTVDLANPRVYEMIQEILNTDLGDVIRLTNLPDEYGPDDVDLIVRGYSEDIGPTAWKITFNCSPGEPWTVAQTALDIYEGFEDSALDIDITNAGSASWARDTTQGHTGTTSFKSGAIANNQVSDAIVAVPPSAERIEFWYKTSSEAAGTGFDGDQLIVLRDGVEQMRAGGTIDWTLFGFDVSANSTVTFRYDKDNSGTAGSDAVWIDDVRFRIPGGRAIVVDDDNSFTTEAMTNTETGMDVACTSKYAWVNSRENYTDFPFDVRVGGEVMRVNSIDPGLFDTFDRTVAAVATDAFGRTVANGWGTADLGGAWTNSGGAAADYNVAAGVGTASAGAVNSSRFTLLPGITNVDMDMQADNSVPVVATGASISTGLRMRQIDTNNYYYIEQIRSTGGTTSIQLVSRVAGVSTVIAGPVSKGAYSAGQMWTIRARVVGNLLQAKLWLTSGTQPDLWDVEAVTSTLPAANPAGTRTILSTGNTNTLPVVSSWDNVRITPITQGWGTSTSGDSWTTSGGNTYDYSVTDGEGMIAMPQVNSSRRVLTGPTWVDADVKCNVQVPVVALTDSIDPGILIRYTSASNYYLGTLHFHNDSTVDVRIRKVVGGVFTTIGISALIPGTYGPGSRYWMRFQVFGNQLKANGWAVGTPEPDWMITAVDNDLTSGGDVGIRSNLQINNTNVLPVTLEFDDFEVLTPQQFNVTRSINGVVKAHATGAKVELAQTPIVPL